VDPVVEFRVSGPASNLGKPATSAVERTRHDFRRATSHLPEPLAREGTTIGRPIRCGRPIASVLEGAAEDPAHGASGGDVLVAVG
jgi:hypothetical protein